MNETQFLDINIRNPSQTRGYYVKYAYKIYSKSKPNPIVLLAGWIQCKENWYDFISYLAKTRMVIVMDHRGIGESKIIFNPNNPNTNTSTIPSFTLSDLSSDIVTLIEYIFGVNKISKTKIDIMGFSLGGMIAQQLAIEYPQYVSNLILCSTTPAGGRHIPFIKSITKQWFKSQSKISQITNKIELKKFLIESALFSLGPLYDKTNKINMERVSDYVSMTMELNKPLQTSMTQLKAMAKWNGIKQLKILNKYSNDFGFDIILIHGDQDNVCDIRNTIFLNERLIGSQTFILKGIGHLICIDPKGRQKLIEILGNLKQNIHMSKL